VLARVKEDVIVLREMRAQKKKKKAAEATLDAAAEE
jgi:hypothetical protein